MVLEQKKQVKLVIVALLTIFLFITQMVAKDVSSKGICKFQYINLVSKKHYTKQYIENAVTNLITANAKVAKCGGKSPHWEEPIKLLKIIKTASSITKKEKTRLLLSLMQYAGESTHEDITAFLTDACYYKTEMVLNTLAGMPYYLRKEFQKKSFYNYLATEACRYPMSVTASRLFNELEENKNRIKKFKRLTNDGNEPVTYYLIQNLKKRNKEIYIKERKGVK